MKIGFTGTRIGMTGDQSNKFCQTICAMMDATEFHHGDCVGADDMAANYVFQTVRDGKEGKHPAPNIKIIVHPPSNHAHRAFNVRFDEIRIAKTYFARNRDIVNETDILIVCPKDKECNPNGGTWYTHDYAKRAGKKIIVIWPDGTLEETPLAMPE